MAGKPTGPLTGRAIHEIYEEIAVSEDVIPWEQVSPGVVIRYELIAKKINARYIQPLQELVNDLDIALQDCWDNEFSFDEIESLHARTKQLLGEETK